MVAKVVSCIQVQGDGSRLAREHGPNIIDPFRPSLGSTVLSYWPAAWWMSWVAYVGRMPAWLAG